MLDQRKWHSRATRRHDHTSIHALAAPTLNRPLHSHLRPTPVNMLVQKQASTDGEPRGFDKELDAGEG